MLISKVYEKINHCLELSESMNLTNNEEETITLELVRNFNKLLKLILTKNEKNKFKTKIKLIKRLPQIQQLKKVINEPKGTIQWHPYLSIKSNLLLHLSKNHNATLTSIYKDLFQVIYQPSKKRKKSDQYYIIEHNTCHSLTEIRDYFDSLLRLIKIEDINHIIISSQCFLTHGIHPILNEIELISNALDGSLIIDISKDSHFNEALELITHISSLNSTKQFGLSIPLNDKKTVKNIDQIFASLSNQQAKRFILRIKKGTLTPYINKLTGKSSYTYEQQIKMNTYYKWSIFTIMNYVRKNQCECLINSNNLYDIAWGLTIRAQMDMEKNIKFETNMTKFPNIAKLLYMINQTALQTESLILTPNIKNKLNIMLDKLIHQGHIYNGYKGSTIHQKLVFKKSHKRFFNYLRRNFLEKYLNKFDD